MARFQIKNFGHEAVVFDTASGDTHFLASYTLSLFQILQNNPSMGESEVNAALASHLSLSVSSHLTHLKEEALTSLHRIGLLETR